MCGDESIYKGILSLAPSSYVIFNTPTTGVPARYAAQPAKGIETDPRKPALERLDELISTAVRLRLRADVPVGVLLSGGIDSGIVSAIAARQSP